MKKNASLNTNSKNHGKFLKIIFDSLWNNPQEGLEQNLHPHPRLRYYLHVAHSKKDQKINNI